MEVEGWTPEHDDQHAQGELALAASNYARAASHAFHPDGSKRAFCMSLPPHAWPWATSWWKPQTPRQDLVRAGALILAEIERLDRAEAAK
jgi:hypothetical protein